MKPSPSFRRPPVAEVATAVQFDDIADLTGPRLGLLWTRFREAFPKLQVHPQRSQTFEQFGVLDEAPQVELELIEGHPSPLVWYVSEDSTELIQVQKNRFVFNWRRREEAYPRYHHVRSAFLKHFLNFREFLSEEGLAGELRMNQWEVTYRNHIVPGVWKEHCELGMVLPSWQHRRSGGFLPEPEDVAVRLRYRIRQDERPIGRLHIVAEPVYDRTTGQPLIVLRLTARGTGPDTTEELLRRLDVGREWIVRGFTCITSPQMHEDWERET